MTIEEAIKKNPFDPDKGNESAYCRYLRYNVEGWYNLDKDEYKIASIKEIIDGKIN